MHTSPTTCGPAGKLSIECCLSERVCLCRVRAAFIRKSIAQLRASLPTTSRKRLTAPKKHQSQLVSRRQLAGVALDNAVDTLWASAAAAAAFGGGLDGVGEERPAASVTSTPNIFESIFEGPSWKAQI
jgi:hypothetical protein